MKVRQIFPFASYIFTHNKKKKILLRQSLHMARDLKKNLSYVIQAREYFIISYHPWAMIWSIFSCLSIICTATGITNMYLFFFKSSANLTIKVLLFQWVILLPHTMSYNLKYCLHGLLIPENPFSVTFIKLYSVGTTLKHEVYNNEWHFLVNYRHHLYCIVFWCVVRLFLTLFYSHTANFIQVCRLTWPMCKLNLNRSWWRNEFPFVWNCSR